MEFRRHDNPLMGIFVETHEPDVYGRTRTEWVFNLAENPERAEQYLAWLAEGHTPEPWEAPVADQ